MGLTKQYRRFLASSSFGVIGSPRGGIQRVPGHPGWVVTSKSETAIVWNLNTGEKVKELVGEGHEVTAIKVAQPLRSGKRTNEGLVAIGYNDGSIKLFDLQSGQCEVTFNGHKSAITTMAFDDSCLRLCSGARDCNVIVWDVVNESGLYRLQGHKGPITKCSFMSRKNVLITSSKDTFIKFWDLDIQHCFSTIAAHVTEVWDFALLKKERYLVTGSSDSELRVWRLTFQEEEVNSHAKTVEPLMKRLRVKEEGSEGVDEFDGEDDDSGLLVEKMGSILRAGQDKVAHIEVDATDRLIACHGSDNSVELFLVCSDEEVKRRCQKKAKKERRKVAKREGQEIVETPEPTIQEEFRRLKAIRAGGKVRAVTLDVEKSSGLVYLLTANNMVEKFALSLEEKNSDIVFQKALDHAGHRSDVRTVAFSSDNTAVLSGSHESVKIWNRSAQVCLRTIPTGYCLSSFFAPGDRQVVVGTKKGSLQIIDVAAAEVTENVEKAHAKEIWSMSLTADKKGFVTASADQSVKFWNFELLAIDGNETKKLSIVHTRTLKLEEDALAVKLSEDGRLIAVSLLDSTVKVFFVDSLKFFLSLYGHKLPALALDISSDSTLIVTGSADKNIKIWGLDFGDCHKSIFAHDDNVTAVKFIPNTHMFFTAGKDGKVKQWDADNFERIVTLSGHHGEIWSLAVSSSGKFAVTSGHDKTLRLWERSEEIIVLDDERETEREKEGDADLATGDARVIPGQQDKEAGLPSKKSAESEKGAERLMEAIELFRIYQAELKDKMGVLPPLPPLMLAYQVQTAEDYMAKMIEMIKLSEIEQTLLVLPFDVVLHLMEIIEALLEKRKSVEVVSRMFFFLIEIHYGPISSAKAHHPMLKRLRDSVSVRLAELRDMVGFNVAALQYHLNKRSERERALELVESVTKLKEKRRKKKNKEKALQTAVLSL